MTTVSSTGSETAILSTTNSDFNEAADAAYSAFEAAFATIDVFSLTSTLIIDTQISTHLVGHYAGGGSVDLTGTGLTGTTGNLHTAAKGTITNVTYNDANVQFSINGNMSWAETTGISKGTATLIHALDHSTGSEVNYTGHMNVLVTGGALELASGTISHINVTTAAGVHFDMTGSVTLTGSGAQGTISQFAVSDDFGHAITMTGNFQYLTLLDTMNSTSTVANFFDSPLFTTGADVFTTADGNAHTWLGGAGNDKMTGGTGTNDTLDGGAGNDTLDGGNGNDKMIGGLGDDVYHVDNLADSIIENANEGKDTVFSSGSYILADNVENLTLTGTGNINGTGNTGNNIITGNAGNNMLDGGLGGADTLIGGAGDDVYSVYIGDSTKIADTSGHDTVIGYSNNYTMATGIEDFQASGISDVVHVIGNTLANHILGDSLINTLEGGAGDDTLEGLGGNDFLNGGAGNDTYVIDNTGVTITDSAGIDTIKTSISMTLGAGIENAFIFNGSGAAIEGNAANNHIVGGAGGDDIVGQGGNDTLEGSGGSDAMGGGDGNDTLDGGIGDDNLFGNAGNDTYVVDSTSDSITENSNEGTDTVKSAVNWVLGDNFENLILTVAGHVGVGNALANTITGTAGNDTLDGGIGADHLNGGLGSDLYYVDNIHDVLTESTVNAGSSDVVTSSVDWTLGANFESLVLTDGAIKGTGNTLNNIIVGNGNSNTLSGSTGDDTLVSGGGEDIMLGGTGHDLFIMNVAGQLSINDFKVAEDKINISDILLGYVDGVSTISDFVHFSAGAPAGHMFLDVDPNGTVGGASFSTRITITGTGLDVETLHNNGVLILG